MKTWNEIEAKLKLNSEGGMPRHIHDRIMRDVRDERATTSIEPDVPRHFPAGWLLAIVTTLIAVALVFVTRNESRQPKFAKADVSAPVLSLATIEEMATAPVANEAQNLRSDLSSAASFLMNCLPAADSGG